MKKEDRQIEWLGLCSCYEGYYKGRNIFDVLKTPCGDWCVYLNLNRLCGSSPQELCAEEIYTRTYSTFKDAKCGAERFLKSLQETIK